MNRNKSDIFKKGFKSGIPIGIGYMAVSFTLGILANKCGLSFFQAVLSSALCNASAGEYAGFTAIKAGIPYLEMFLICVIVNARYLIMSASMSQKIEKNISGIHRFFMGFMLTDEIFAVSISEDGEVSKEFVYGVEAAAIPCWTIGAAIGVILGDVLPGYILSALSVALYGMFIAVVIPPARDSKVIAITVFISMFLSFIGDITPPFSGWTSENRVIVLTIVVTAIVAKLHPIEEE